MSSQTIRVEVFGSDFINIYADVKNGGFETFMELIGPW